MFWGTSCIYDLRVNNNNNSCSYRSIDRYKLLRIRIHTLHASSRRLSKFRRPRQADGPIRPTQAWLATIRQPTAKNFFRQQQTLEAAERGEKGIADRVASVPGKNVQHAELFLFGKQNIVRAACFRACLKHRPPVNDSTMLKKRQFHSGGLPFAITKHDL